MIHGIFIRNTPKNSWRLFSTVATAEAAASELKVAKAYALKEGFDEAEVIVQTFDSALRVPEYIKHIKIQPSLYS